MSMETPEQIAERIVSEWFHRIGVEDNPASDDQLVAATAAAIQAERDRSDKAGAFAMQLRSGWSQIRDLAMAGNGPAEFFNFHEAIRLEDGKCVESVIRYLNNTVARAEKFESALQKINVIRNSIIAFQSCNFSEHVYPLVAALNEAGFTGMDYPEARANFGTLLERTNAAEARAEKAERELAEAEKLITDLRDFKCNWHTRQECFQWIERRKQAQPEKT